MDHNGDRGRAREEFLAEAQELTEAISRDLLVLDTELGKGHVSPETVNDLFRGVHTLKGLAGMFGFTQLGEVAHVLEDLLEDLRLGRVELTQHTLDVIFEGADGFQRLLRSPSGSDASLDVEAFAARVHGVVKADPTVVNILDAYDFDPGMLSVLTEYEEHRLRANLESGHTIFRLGVQLPIDGIDTELEQIKERCKPIGECITCLPSMDGGSDDAIDIEMLIASVQPLAELQRVIDRPKARLVSVALKDGTRLPTQHPTHHPTAIPSTIAGTLDSPAEKDAAALTLRSLSSAVRVDIHKLDYLMNVVGELGTVRSALGRTVESLRSGTLDLRGAETEMHRIHRAFSRRLAEVQGGVLDIRMVPLSQLFDKVAVIVRGVARDQGKNVRLLVTGGDTEVDKLIVEELADPLMHIVRNAIDHGVEPEAERGASGKPEAATVAINAYPKGNHVLIELSDDGRGINPNAVRESVMRKGLLSEQDVADISPSELLNIIFMPGFSTKETVTDLSGRGVGMDVVKTNINRLGGAVEVESESGVGTKFTITLPITLAIISALLFEVRGRTMSLPLASVQEAILLRPSMIKTVEGREVLTLRGETLPLCRLDKLCRFEGGEVAAAQYVIVTVVGHRRLGLVVDKLAGQQDIVIKGLGRSLTHVPFISGATDLGDQRLVLVLDSQSIIEETLSTKAGGLSLSGGVS